MCALTFSVAVVLGAVLGCAGTKTTSVTTVTESAPAAPPDTVSVEDHEPEAPTQHTTVTTTTTSKERPDGVIGSAFHLVGTVIAFPFRVVGGALDALF
jgi:hypothetical protein